MIQRKSVMALVMALTLGLAVGTSQAAKTKKLVSNIEIEGLAPNTAFTFIGDVHSRKNKCERNRTVTLYYNVGGEFEDVGTTTTDRTGDWEISPNLVGDTAFYAAVEKRKIGAGDRKLVCKAADSPQFFLEA
jgi:hypothetical protein